MKVRELYEYLMECCDKGFGDAELFVCDNRDNPLTDGLSIADCSRIESRSDGRSVVLQTC